MILPNLRHNLKYIIEKKNELEMSMTSTELSSTDLDRHWQLTWPWKFADGTWQYAAESGILFH